VACHHPLSEPAPAATATVNNEVTAPATPITKVISS